MERIRPLRRPDAPAVARLHRAAMGNSLWARLGTTFLTRLYEGLVRDPRFVGFVYEEEGAVRGFIAGTTNGERLFRDTLVREAPHLIWPALVGILRDPGVLIPLLATPFYFRRSLLTRVPAESLFCSFEPELRGKRISGHINKVLFDDLYARGHQRVKITTESDNLGAVRQLRSWGFVEAGAFRFYGKPMTAYVLDLSECERVEAVRRYP